MADPVPPGTDDPAPVTVGPYRLGKLLGSGASGRVHAAVDGRGREVAVKIVRRERATEPGFRTRFRREIGAARRMPARYTAPVVDADPDGDPPWVATALLRGPTLDRRIRDGGPLRGRELTRLATGLLRALVAMHRSGLVHRDLKPANVVLTPRGPMVVDFGIAHTPGDTRMTRTGGTLGTPAYLAPEQVDGTVPEPGPAADVHAFGAVLVFAATGAPPYPGDTVPAVFYRLLHGTPDLGATPEPLRAVAAACLRRDPAERPSATALLARVRRRGRAVAVAVAAAVAVAVGVPAVVLLRPDGPATAPDPVPAAERADVPGAGPAATAPGPPPTTVGPVVDLGHRADRVVAAAGRIHVADPDGRAVTVLDPAGAVLGRADVGGFPAALAVAPDGRRLYVALSSTPTRVVAVDTQSLTVTASAEIGTGAGAEIVWSPDVVAGPDAVVVTDPRSSTVTALDPATLRPLGTAEPATRPVAADAAGDAIVVAGSDPAGGSRIETVRPPWTAAATVVPGPDDVLDLVALPGGAVVPAVAGTADGVPGLRLLGPDGTVRATRADVPASRLAAAPGLVYALDASTGTVTVLDAGTLATVAEIPGAGAAADLAVAPDGRALYLTAGRTLRIVTAQ
ncbi:protein kinase [Pseudonocardia sp. NPDC046786]|uniref:serine/threonine-protein kinase n=1 Tax=Pseudonocardia sp. NPDC046786 TaxID=3155471 RepID=UPI0033F27383